MGGYCCLSGWGDHHLGSPADSDSEPRPLAIGWSHLAAGAHWLCPWFLTLQSLAWAHSYETAEGHE